VKQLAVAPAGGIGFTVSAGESLRIVDVGGGQVADLVVFAAGDHGEWFSGGRTLDYNGSLCPAPGQALYSNRSRAMLMVESDDVGVHDMLHPACSREMYRIQYGWMDAPNCLDNLVSSLAPWSIGADAIPAPFNVFMHVVIGDEGDLEVRPPPSQPGDGITFRAGFDLIAAVSSCPAPSCRGDGRIVIEVG